MAPEQIEGKPCLASDQYALGILTYEWLSGRRPFQGTPVEIMMQHITIPPTSLSQQAPRLAAEVEQVVFTALAKDPNNVLAVCKHLHGSHTSQPAAASPTFPAIFSSFPAAIPSRSENHDWGRSLRFRHAIQQ